MASEEINTSAQSTDHEGEDVVTITEVLESQQQLIEDTEAVLGGADDKNCTYSEGYMKRQALYACLTCIPEAKNDFTKSAGVCLACCYHCHDGHELIELYTKRNFRCDCGNKKFENSTCTLNPNKEDYNESNLYNHNFSGKYCTCERPYPDPEDSVSDDMIQCVICEDWYHSRHLTDENMNQYAEVVCEGCVKKNEVFSHYDHLTVKVPKVVDGETSKEANSTEVTENKEDTEQKDTKESQETSTSACKKQEKSGNLSTKFWADISWRQQLCHCITCEEVYNNSKLSFIFDPQDSVQIYEENGKVKAQENVEKREMEFLNSVDRVPLMETIAGYNNMKTHLVEYLRKFAENKKVVREEDIREFFSGYDPKKRMKCDIPHSCR